MPTNVFCVKLKSTSFTKDLPQQGLSVFYEITWLIVSVEMSRVKLDNLIFPSKWGENIRTGSTLKQSDLSLWLDTLCGLMCSISSISTWMEWAGIDSYTHTHTHHTCLYIYIYKYTCLTSWPGRSRWRTQSCYSLASLPLLRCDSHCGSVRWVETDQQRCCIDLLHLVLSGI